jgi:CTP:molybdopterin cytidylyltransferase MocA
MASKLACTPVIVLAGGKSSRMGYPKGLVEHQGRTWLETQLDRLAACGLHEASVVLGFHAELYMQRIPWLRDALAPEGTLLEKNIRVRTVINPHPELGPFSSIQTGANAELSRTSSEALWILPVDVPCPDVDVWKRLNDSCALISVPVFQGRGGHPVRLSRSFMQKLADLPAQDPSARLDHQIRAAGPLVDRVEVQDPGVLSNFNTPGDFCSRTFLPACKRV